MVGDGSSSSKHHTDLGMVQYAEIRQDMARFCTACFNKDNSNEQGATQ